MENTDTPRRRPSFDPLRDDGQALIPAASWLRYDSRADGWTPGRQAAFVTHLADHGIVEAAAKAAGKSLSGAYALRRRGGGYAFSLGWEAALLLARRIVADKLMAAAVQGERAEWVREEGRTTYTRFNPRIATNLLDRVDPMDAFTEVLAVVSHFDYFLHLIETGVDARELWDFFDCALARDDLEPRNRVRTCLLLSDESADLAGDDAEGVGEIEVKSMGGMVTLERSPLPVIPNSIWNPASNRRGSAFGDSRPAPAVHLPRGKDAIASVICWMPNRVWHDEVGQDASLPAHLCRSSLARSYSAP